LRKERNEVQQHQEQQASIQPLLQQQQRNTTTSNPLNQFIYALRSSEAQKQYSIRLKMFFNFLDLHHHHGTLDEQAQFFLDKARENGVQWIRRNQSCHKKTFRVRNKDAVKCS
jgi:hypothetical protein